MQNINNQFNLYFPSMEMKKKLFFDITDIDQQKILIINLWLPMFDNMNKIINPLTKLQSNWVIYILYMYM